MSVIDMIRTRQRQLVKKKRSIRTFSFTRYWDSSWLSSSRYFLPTPASYSIELVLTCFLCTVSNVGSVYSGTSPSPIFFYLYIVLRTYGVGRQPFTEIGKVQRKHARRNKKNGDPKKNPLAPFGIFPTEKRENKKK